MPGNPVAVGFTRGFFGCFGVLAAIVVAVFAAIVWGSWSSDREAAAVMAGTADFTGPNNPCITAWVRVRHEYAGFEDVDPEASTAVTVRPGPRYECGIFTGGRMKRVGFRIVCGRLLDPACLAIDSYDAGLRHRSKRR